MGDLSDREVRFEGRTYYAAERWAGAVLKGVLATEDPRTLSKWGRVVGISPASLTTWCRAAQVSPRRSLELARLSRALRLTGGTFEGLHEVLDIVEPRTIQRLLRRAGLQPPINEPAPPVVFRRFLQQQTLIQNEKAVKVLAVMLQRMVTLGTEPTPSWVGDERA